MAAHKKSGWQRRKLRREQQAALAAAGLPVIPPLPDPGVLETVGDYRREINVIYRGMRRGALCAEDAWRATRILDIAAEQAFHEEQCALKREELEIARQQVVELRRLQPGGAPIQDYLPAPGEPAINGAGATDQVEEAQPC